MTFPRPSLVATREKSGAVILTRTLPPIPTASSPYLQYLILWSFIDLGFISSETTRLVRPITPTAVKVAGTVRPRLSAQIPQICSRCAQGSHCAGRAALTARSYGTVASYNPQSSRSAPLPAELAAIPPKQGRQGASADRKWRTRSTGDSWAQRSSGSRHHTPVKSHFYVPNLSSDVDVRGSGSKIHILGEDIMSKFIAHQLSAIYEDVESVGFGPARNSKYRNIEAVSFKGRPAVAPVPLAHPDPTPVESSTGPIDHLIVTGQGCEVGKAIESVKDRVDGNTNICLMNEGLGVLEEAKRAFLNDPRKSPNFWLGHMSHQLVYNRKNSSVKQLRPGQVQITQQKKFNGKAKSYDPGTELSAEEYRSDFIKSLQTAKSLQVQSSPFDAWLRFKLPSVVFKSVVDPVCAMLDMHYDGLGSNRAAQRMMYQLINEIVQVLDNIPEVAGSSIIRDYAHTENLARIMWGKIRAKRHAPCDLSLQIQHGLPTDVGFLNGYFVRRAEQLGIGASMNKLMAELIKARHARSVEKRNSWIPMDEMSMASEHLHKQRTLPGKDRPFQREGR